MRRRSYSGCLTSVLIAVAFGSSVADQPPVRFWAHSGPVSLLWGTVTKNYKEVNLPDTVDEISGSGSTLAVNASGKLDLFETGERIRSFRCGKICFLGWLGREIVFKQASEVFAVGLTSRKPRRLTLPIQTKSIRMWNSMVVTVEENDHSTSVRLLDGKLSQKRKWTIPGEVFESAIGGRRFLMNTMADGSMRWLDLKTGKSRHIMVPGYAFGIGRFGGKGEVYVSVASNEDDEHEISKFTTFIRYGFDTRGPIRLAASRREHQFTCGYLDMESGWAYGQETRYHPGPSPLIAWNLRTGEWYEFGESAYEVYFYKAAE